MLCGPKRLAVSCCHAAVPDGAPRRTDRLNAANSPGVSTPLTCSSQSNGRGRGQQSSRSRLRPWTPHNDLHPSSLGARRCPDMQQETGVLPRRLLQRGDAGSTQTVALQIQQRQMREMRRCCQRDRPDIADLVLDQRHCAQVRQTHRISQDPRPTVAITKTPPRRHDRTLPGRVRPAAPPSGDTPRGGSPTAANAAPVPASRTNGYCTDP